MAAGATGNLSANAPESKLWPDGWPKSGTTSINIGRCLPIPLNLAGPYGANTPTLRNARPGADALVRLVEREIAENNMVTRTEPKHSATEKGGRRRRSHRKKGSKDGWPNAHEDESPKKVAQRRPVRGIARTLVRNCSATNLWPVSSCPVRGRRPMFVRAGVTGDLCLDRCFCDGRLWSTLVRIWSKSADFGRHQPNLCRHTLNLATFDATLIEVCPMLVALGVNPAEFGPKMCSNLVKLGRNRPSFVRSRPK